MGKRLLLRWFVALCCLFVGAWMPESALADTLADMVAKIKLSVVGVGTDVPTRVPRGQFRGTGFVVADGYHVITNAHVLPDTLNAAHNESLVVFIGKGEKAKLRRAREVAVDKAHDLALLKISGSPMPAMKLGEDKGVREGETYAFTGFPIGLVLGLYPVTHRGIVSAITPIVIPARNSQQLNAKLIRRMTDPYKVFQLDATAYPGNSGSPLYDPETGKVVGVINKVFVKESKEAVLEKPSGITYAIPVKYVKALLKRHDLSS